MDWIFLITLCPSFRSTALDRTVYNPLQPPYTDGKVVPTGQNLDFLFSDFFSVYRKLMQPKLSPNSVPPRIHERIVCPLYWLTICQKQGSKGDCEKGGSWEGPPPLQTHTGLRVGQSHILQMEMSVHF